MKQHPQLQVFQRSLADPQQLLCAVLDGASVPNLPARLAAAAVLHLCLLPGDIDDELAQVAPYLAQFPADSPFAAQFITEGLGNHWGILATSAAQWCNLRIHFHKLLTVWEFNGQPRHFRYYDPRVLRVYVPTCTAAELSDFFGPVTAFYAEGDTPITLQRLFLNDANLIQQTLQLV
jgi:hypothetical protein